MARITELEPVLGVGAAALEKVPGVKIVTTLHNGPADSALYSWQFVTLALCMMAGTASLPHILMRYFTTPTVRSARRSVSWSLFFIFLLYFTAPALATLTKLQTVRSEPRDRDHRQVHRAGAETSNGSSSGHPSACSR